jgi:hypothetical protein
MYPVHRQARKVCDFSFSITSNLQGTKFCLAKYLDHGLYHLAFPLPVCVWFSRSPNKVGFPPLGRALPNGCGYISWRWSYGIGSMYSAFVLFLIVFFGRET